MAIDKGYRPALTGFKNPLTVAFGFNESNKKFKEKIQ